MSNLVKYYLEGGTYQKLTVWFLLICVLIFTSLSIIAPTSFNLTYTLVSSLLILTYMVEGVSRLSNEGNLSSLPRSLLAILVLPAVLASISSHFYLILVPLPQRSSFLGGPAVTTLTVVSSLFMLFHSVGKTFIYKSKPSNILWLKIADGGSNPISKGGGSYRRHGWLDLPYFGKIVFSKVGVDQEIDFGNIKKGAQVKIILDDGRLHRDSILSVATESGIPIYTKPVV